MDHGASERLKITDLYPIRQTFLTMPYKHCLFDLENVNFKKGDTHFFTSFFADLVKRCSKFRVLVVRKNAQDDLLKVCLFAQVNDTNEHLFVNKHLQALGYTDS